MIRVGRVGEFDAYLAVRGRLRSQNIGHHIHRAALHGTVEERPDFVLGFVGSHPVIGRSRIFFLMSADERDAFGAGYVVRIAAMKVASWVGFLIQLYKRAIPQHLSDQAVDFTL
jgi:hypothetical protein